MTFLQCLKKYYSNLVIVVQSWAPDSESPKPYLSLGTKFVHVALIDLDI